ncbi:MAG: LysR family transcriptional regulator [Marinobacterium sp.]|nr:LysR family transcriptional regulator [Marinobacterium sp.]
MQEAITLDLNLLKVFVAVMRSRSVARAAETLSISSPAVSQSLNKLRDHYQDRLFVRQGREMEPTVFATTLFTALESSFVCLEENTRKVERFLPERSKRRFVVACHQDLCAQLAPEVYRRLAQINPDLEVCFDCHHYDDIAREKDLRLNQVDLMICTVPVVDRNFENRMVFQQPLVVAYNPNHPEVQGDVTAEQFFAGQHIVWRPQRFNISTLPSLAQQDMPKRNVVMLSESIFNSMSIVADSELFCVTTLSHADHMLSINTRLRLSPLPVRCARMQFYLTWYQGLPLSPARRWLIELLTEAFASLKYRHPDAIALAQRLRPLTP